MGTLLKPGGKPFESPGKSDREQMLVTIRELCKKLGITPADLQADLWYHEQALYRMLGADADRVKSVSYAGAADKYIDPRSAEALRVKLAKTRNPRVPMHTRLLGALGGKSWARHNKRIAIQKHKDDSISVFVHGRRVVTASPDGSEQWHGTERVKL